MSSANWNRRKLHGATLALLAILCVNLPAPQALAQAYPVKPVRVIIPYPPGGGMDTVMRTLGEKLTSLLGQTVLVDNRPGAGATIGADLAAKSPPDGYTMFMGSIADYAIAPFFYPKLSFDLKRDFAPIADVGYGTIALVITPGLPVNSVKEFIAYAKAKPGQLHFASSGYGAIIHLTGEMFKQMAGIDAIHVPYKGTALFLPDLMSGRVEFALDNVLAHLPHIKAGRERALAVASRQRSPLLPELPTMIESGFSDFESATRYTLFAPHGTPKEIIAKLNAETNAALKQPDLRDRLQGLGIVISGSTPDAVTAMITAESARWAKVIRDGNIQPEKTGG